MRKEGHRLEAVIACRTSPEIGQAAGSGLYPFWNGDRFAALGAGIFPGQGGEVYSGHTASPFFLLCLKSMGQDCCQIPTAATAVLEKVIRQFHGIVIAPRMRAAVSRNEA
jgi:hypothetical protein